MGHCEMLLAVAGLDQNAVAERTQRLASGDWSRFTPGERAAFAFTRKQAQSPAAVNAEDVQELVRHFGTARALDVIWWVCRCHYMTRVADGFQLPLERDNVFEGLAPANGKRVLKKP
jgi:alkylhydroperoxidase family enzyme